MPYEAKLHVEEELCPLCSGRAEIVERLCEDCKLPLVLWGTVKTLVETHNRLKEGKLTEEEFQNLCHNLPQDSGCRFIYGCRQWWKKLGFKDPIDELSRENQDLRMAVIRAERQKYCTEVMAYPNEAERIASLEQEVARLATELIETTEKLEWLQHDRS